MTALGRSTSSTDAPKADRTGQDRRSSASGPGPIGPDGQPQARPFQPPGWQWAKAETSDVGWWVRPNWRSVLLTEDGRLKLDDWRAKGLLETVKASPHRIVYRVNLPEGTVYLKHFLIPGRREMLRQWFRRGKGRNEGKRALRLAGLGVPTTTPIALGEQRKHKFLFENYLITTEIPNAQPLDQFLEQTLPTIPEPRASRIRRRLAETLGRLTAKLHQAGLVHLDFHPGNLLIRLEGEDGDQPWLAIIDTDALRFRGRVSKPMTISNLAMLNHYFWFRTDRAIRFRFLRAYAQATSEEPRAFDFDLGPFAHSIEQATRRWAERLWTRWGRRCLGRNKYFDVCRHRESWAIAGRSLDLQTVGQLLDDPDAPFQAPGSTILKHSRTTTVAALTMTVDGRPSPVVYKRFNCKKRLEPVWSLVRPSRAWRAWRAGHHLRSRGLPTPENLLIIGRRNRQTLLGRLIPAPRVTYLLTRKAEPAVTFGDFVRNRLPELPEADRRRTLRRLTTALARLIRALHDRSLSDRDLKVDNVLIEGDPTADRPRLSLIDLVGVRLIFPLPRHRRAQNLARLLLSLSALPGWSRTESLRFLNTYLPPKQRRQGAWKPFWRRIERRMVGKVAQNARRGRLLS